MHILDLSSLGYTQTILVILGSRGSTVTWVQAVSE